MKHVIESYPITGQPEDYGLTRNDEQLNYWRYHELGLKTAQLFADNELADTLIAKEVELDNERLKLVTAEYEATHDSLTGLLNRSGLDKELAAILNPSLVSVVYADATNLKAVNDLISHEKGDEVLKKVANILSTSVRDDDRIARVGGDEFILLVQSANAKDVNGIKNRIDNQIKNYLIDDSEALSVGFCLATGTALPDSDTKETRQLIIEAEIQMKQHKSVQHKNLGSYRKF